MLHTETSRRERILGFGKSGAGKTTAWVKIAEWLEGSGNQFYVIDTDGTCEASLPYPLPSHIHVYDVEDWDDYKPTIKKIREQSQSREDWLVVDMVDKPWSKAQEGFFEKAYGKEIDEFFIEAKRAGTGVGGDYGSNWQAINTMYGQFIQPVQRFPGHLFCVTPATDVRQSDRSGKGGDSKEIIRDFGRLGVRPSGQKDLAHLFHTVLLFQEAPKNWTLTTSKDRNRERLEGVVLEDFVVQYLVAVAGWKP